jgi:hypothetical protein
MGELRDKTAVIYQRLGTYPDDETGYFGHTGLPPIQSLNYIKPYFIGGGKLFENNTLELKEFWTKVLKTFDKTELSLGGEHEQRQRRLYYFCG